MINEVLRQIDLQGETLGWGTGPHSGPQVFAVWENQDHGHEFSFVEPLNDALMELNCVFGHDIGATLTHIAESTEKVRAFWRTAGVPAHDKGLLGIGMRSEAVKPNVEVLEFDEDDAPGTLMDIMALVSKAIGGAAPVTETRMVCFFHRDGGQLQIDHDRGQMPVMRDSVMIGFGGVEVALVKLLNTLVPEEVPLPHGPEM